MKRNSGRMFYLGAGVVAGTALGWLTAPQRGASLRARARQRLQHLARLGRRRLVRMQRNVDNRVRGRAAELRERASAGHSGWDVDANTLVDRVHSELGRQFGATFEHVNLNGAGHTVYLHGYVGSFDERERLVEAIQRIEGVEAVRSEELRIGIHPASAAGLAGRHRQAR